MYLVFTEDVPLAEFMYLVKLYNLHACKVRVTIGDSGLCCCTCVCYVFRALISSLVHCTGNKLCVEVFSFLLCLLTQFL